MRILECQEVLYAIENNLIKITPHFIPDYMRQNIYEIHPYSVIDLAHLYNTDGIKPVTNQDIALTCGKHYIVSTVENVLVANPKFKIGVSCPYLSNNVAYDQIKLNNQDGISIRFIPQYGLNINSKTPIANIFFLYDGETLEKAKTKSKKEVYWTTPSIQTIEPTHVEVEQANRKKQYYFEKTH